MRDSIRNQWMHKAQSIYMTMKNMRKYVPSDMCSGKGINRYTQGEEIMISVHIMKVQLFQIQT